MPTKSELNTYEFVTKNIMPLPKKKKIALFVLVDF